MNKKLGIRYEDRFNMERRVAIIPRDVEKLKEKHEIEFFVEKSAKRVFTDDEFLQAGAELVDDVSDIPVIFGVKEMPIAYFGDSQTYIFFSHTIKGQSYNMPALKQMIAKRINLIDYEKVTDDEGRRLIFFGRYAGLAGMINSLWSLGLRLKDKDDKNPFLGIDQSHTYSSLEDAKEAVIKAGEAIKEGALKILGRPLVVGFTGYGNVSRGAQEILELLPFIEILPEQVPKLHQDKSWDPGVVYKVVFKEKDLAKPKKDTGIFDLQDYYNHPEKYQSDFDQYIDHLSVLMNCMYWDDRYPKLITNDYLSEHYNKDHALKVIGDITCDPNGSIECTLNCTEIETPVFIYDPEKRKITKGYEGNGLLIMAVDILPSELPRESSIGFSSALFPFVNEIVKADYSKSFEELDLPGPIKRAMILHNGQFTPDYTYMKQYIEE